MKNIIVKLANIDKTFEENHVVKNLSMDIYEGEFLTMLGPSGCGKTTTLRMIAGFEDPTNGDIAIENEVVNNKEPYNRNVNTVFQNYALFPHMTIYENVAYGLAIKKVNKKEIKQRVTKILELVQLSGFEKRKPDQLSGGQKQRVAIARALINNPKVLLLDEPLGALDLKLRKQMQTELKRLQKKLGITFIYVTHDQEEALSMSDRIAIMNGGVLEQVGTPDEIYEKPASRFVADFIGESNIFYGTIKDKSQDIYTLEVEGGQIQAKGTEFGEDEIVYVSIRPEKLLLSKEKVNGFNLVGTVKEHIYIGSTIKTLIMLPTGEEIKKTSVAGDELATINSIVYIYWNTSDAVIIQSKSEVIFNMIDEVKITTVEEVNHIEAI